MITKRHRPFVSFLFFVQPRPLVKAALHSLSPLLVTSCAPFVEVVIIVICMQAGVPKGLILRGL